MSYFINEFPVDLPFVFPFAVWFAVCKIIEHFADSQCTDPFEAVGGSCYVYSGDVGVFVPSYSAALGVCGSLGGYLAMVKRGEENRAVLDTFLLPASETRSPVHTFISLLFHKNSCSNERLSRHSCG